jgi:hypothetical protein
MSTSFILSRQGPATTNCSPKKRLISRRTFLSTPERLHSKLRRMLKIKPLARLKYHLNKTFIAQSAETSTGQPNSDAGSQKKKQRLEKALSPLRHDRTSVAFPRQKAGQTKGSQIHRRAECRTCLGLKFHGSRHKNQKDNQQHEPAKKVASGGRRRSSLKKILRLLTPRSHKAKKTPSPDGTSTAQAGTSITTMPGSPARTTCRVQARYQNRPIETKVIKEDVQQQAQENKRPFQ